MARGSSRRSRFELVDGPLSPAPGSESGPAALGRGTWRQGPGATVVIGAALLLVLVAAIVLPHRAEDAPTPAPTPTLVPSPAISTPVSSCDLADESCRTVESERWRERTAAILREHLDPDDTYFTGYSYSPRSPYVAGSRLDALGLDIYRLDGGGTEVFVQIAKSRASAIRCGQLTRHRCTGQRFMDGNRFSITTTASVSQGIEVQHLPLGTYVITIAARTTTGGRVLELGNGDLIAVAQDPRLQPPPS